VVERVGDDHQDRQEQERVDEDPPDAERQVDGVPATPLRCSFERAHAVSSTIGGSVIVRLARAIVRTASAITANTATVPMIMAMRITACAAPSAQFCAIVNCLATMTPAMFPSA